MSKYMTVGIRPKFNFDRNPVLEGIYVGCEVVKASTQGKKKYKEFTLYVIADKGGTEWTVGGGHIEYLIKKANLKGGEGVRLTFLGWNDLEDGNKCRNYNLEIEVPE